MTAPKSIAAMLQLTPIIPVVTLDDLEAALPLAECLLAANVQLIEMTLRTDAALAAIERIARALPEMTVAAGTVTCPAQLRSVLDAGARLAVSPGNSSALLEAAVASGLPLLPGVASASELMAGLAAGLGHFKLFPAAAVGGTDWLKAMAGPFAEARFCPTGGIGQNDVADYLKQPNVLCVGASWLASSARIRARDWTGITQVVRTALARLDR